MKALSAPLRAHLDGGATTLAWCWRITRGDGVVLGFTDHDRTLVFGGTGFEPESGFGASELRAGSDLSVDAQDAEGVLTSDRITEADILDGRWDNAAVEVWRVNWADASQRVLMRRGAIGQIRRGRASFVAEIRSLAHLLDQTVGRGSWRDQGGVTMRFFFSMLVAVTGIGLVMTGGLVPCPFVRGWRADFLLRLGAILLGLFFAFISYRIAVTP